MRPIRLKLAAILDAICFALYGASSGGGRDGTMMRSDYAAPRKETFVEFTFALKNKIYRVHRTPKYDKQKSRGVSLTSITSRLEKLIDATATATLEEANE